MYGIQYGNAQTHLSVNGSKVMWYDNLFTCVQLDYESRRRGNRSAIIHWIQYVRCVFTATIDVLEISTPRNVYLLPEPERS